jgi:DNA-binding XRE family transcriptional regulator
MNTAPVGLAQHLYRERQIRRLSQGEAALVIGVDPKTYIAWEGGTLPRSPHWPAIIAFLGCDPIVQTPVTIPEMVSAIRRREGLTANELGALLGVYKLTIRAWEAGRRLPRGRVLKRFYDLAARYRFVMPQQSGE